MTYMKPLFPLENSNRVYHARFVRKLSDLISLEEGIVAIQSLVVTLPLLVTYKSFAIEDITTDHRQQQHHHQQQQQQQTMDNEQQDEILENSAAEIEERISAVMLEDAQVAQPPHASVSSSQTVVAASTNSGGRDDVFVNEEVKLQRAKYIFSGIIRAIRAYISTPRQTLEDYIWERIDRKYVSLWKNDPTKMEELTTRPEHGSELCILLGINKNVAEKRFSVINTLREELKESGVRCVTPIINQIHHLVYSFGVKNTSYGDEAHFNAGTDTNHPAAIRQNYKGKDWQSFMGICLRPGKTKKALTIMQDAVEKNHCADCYVHGTGGNALKGINRYEGKLEISRNSDSSRHDFGEGFYVTKGKYIKALCWGIDMCWPIYDKEEGKFRPDFTEGNDFEESFFAGHNPAIIAFPKPRQFKSSIMKQRLFDVETKPPFKDKELKLELAEKYDGFDKKRRGYYKNNTEKEANWKTFVKLARYHELRPAMPQIFKGPLHDADTTTETDRCEEPKMDEDKDFIQYCFTRPDDLGSERLFIEFDVAWDEWLGTANIDIDNKSWEEISHETRKYVGRDVAKYDKPR